MIDKNVFMKCAENLLSLEEDAGEISARRFGSLFGVSPFVVAVVWNEVIRSVRNHYFPVHLLWELNFLKQYSTETVGSIFWKCDEKTLREWTWYFVRKIADMEIVHRKSRLDSDAMIDGAYCSVDETDFPIMEPAPFSSKWYSHKTNGPALRYEIDVSISDGEIVWANGPFQCGTYPDLKIFKNKCYTNWIQMR